MQKLENIRVYSCFDKANVETSCICMEIDLHNGMEAQGRMSASDARVLARILMDAAHTLDAYCSKQGTPPI